MSTIGKGYGSEFHFRSATADGAHPLNEELRGLFSNASDLSPVAIEWHSNYLVKSELEVRGMDFLPDKGGECWRQYWPDPKAGKDPKRSGIHNWDGIGKIVNGHRDEWLLVEAKAHVGEFLNSPACGAGERSRNIIARAFQKTRMAMGLTSSPDAEVPASWFAKGGYQIANRLASLHFLLHEIRPAHPAHLLFIYYVNDAFAGVECPKTPEEWKALLRLKYLELGIAEHHHFTKRIHYLFPRCDQRRDRTRAPQNE